LAVLTLVAVVVAVLKEIPLEVTIMVALEVQAS
jgi:hypothetical protein